MSIIIEKDESNASRRVVEFRTFKSDGTSPDTGSSNSSLRMSIGGNVQFTPNALVSAISANAGMYFLTLNQSDVSQLGNHALWYEGAFAQHVANLQVVGFNPFSAVSRFDPSTTSVGIKTTGILAGAFGADAIDAVALAGMDLSDVTVRIKPLYYSGLTVEGLNNFSNLSGSFSAFTVQVSSGTVSGVANMVQSNVSQIRGRQFLAELLASHISSVVTGIASAGSLAVNQMTSDVAEATNDHYNGRVIIFTTGALAGQGTSINTTGGYLGFSNGSSRFAFPSLTEAPGAGDGFVVV